MKATITTQRLREIIKWFDSRGNVWVDLPFDKQKNILEWLIDGKTLGLVVEEGVTEIWYFE